jgi:YjbE family integral membrane protein
MTFDWQFVTSVLQILIIDVVLSGDNAVVIALAAHRLPSQQRRVAIICGAAGAIALRVLFTWILAQLLGVPLLRFGGGVILVWIAMKLLRDEEDEEQGHHVRTAASLPQAIWIIIMADLVMSLDNMLAVGGASEGHATLILFGLLWSIAIIMTCSAIIADWMNRFPFLVLIGAGVLAWTSGEMMLEDAKVAEWSVTRFQVCLDANWHEEFGGETEHLKSRLMNRHTEARPWWTERQPEIKHHHWAGWACVAGVISLVMLSKFMKSRPQARVEQKPAESTTPPAPDGPGKTEPKT